MAEKTVRICDLCIGGAEGIATSAGALAWRGSRGSIDVCQEHRLLLERATGAASATETAAPKRRGRPPKVKAEGMETAAPKRRGRPPKVKAEGVETAAPKRRGRPPKVKAEGVETTAPKRRGRPPKVKAEGVESAKPTVTRKVTAMKKPVKTVLTPSSGTIRAWAEANDVSVSKRGAIGASTLAAYYAAHPDITHKVEVKDKPKKTRGHRVAAKTKKPRAKQEPDKVLSKEIDPFITEKESKAEKEVDIPLAEFSGASA